MSEIEFVGGPIRQRELSKLKVFLANPGKFCLIVLGSRGTGKHFAIESAFAQIGKNATKELCLTGLKFMDSIDFPTESAMVDKLFKQHEFQTLVIEDVEDLSDEQQKLLFKALSTKDGTFGINKRFNLRIVFTSSKNIDALRTDLDLLGVFWDRISQLIVELPSYQKEDENILKDFYSTWNKMKFGNTKGYEKLAGTPKNAALEKFLEENADKFEGGFRDLDKIACLYFNYRIYHYGTKKKILDEIEKEVISSVKEDFFAKSQLQASSENDAAVFEFEPNKKHWELQAKYKMQLRRWAVKEHGSVRKAEKELGYRPGTMKNFVASKLSKPKKASKLDGKNSSKK